MVQHDTRGHDAYEKTDAEAGPTYRAGFTILGAMFLTALVLVPLYRLFGRSETREQKPAASLVKPDPAAPTPSFPRLVISEPAALAAFRAQEDALLDSYGWVEKDKGIARMPIEEAMKIVAEQGLPKFPTPAPTPAPARGAR